MLIIPINHLTKDLEVNILSKAHIIWIVRAIRWGDLSLNQTVLLKMINIKTD